MALFERSKLCHEAPEQYDALLPRERQVLAMWDKGSSPAEIAAALKISEVTANLIVCLYDDRLDPDPNAAIRRGSEMLRARILQFHPHVAFGGES